MRTTRTTTWAVAAALAACALAVPATASAVPAAPGGAHGNGNGPGNGHGNGHGHGARTPELEDLDRGLVAASTSEGVFLSWRLLGEEVTGTTDTGMAGPAFAVYRDRQRIATVTDSTNFVDPDGSARSTYRVAPLERGRAGKPSEAVRPWGQDFLDVPLNKPADGVTPVGEAYTYAANDASVADLDGDGAYEIVVKWDPSNAKDVSQVGYTGNAYLDAYELDGTQLWRKIGRAHV